MKRTLLYDVSHKLSVTLCWDNTLRLYKWTFSTCKGGTWSSNRHWTNRLSHSWSLINWGWALCNMLLCINSHKGDVVSHCHYAKMKSKLWTCTLNPTTVQTETRLHILHVMFSSATATCHFALGDFKNLQWANQIKPTVIYSKLNHPTA